MWLGGCPPLLRPDWSVLEFGSGLSTIWLGRRVKRVFSVESDDDWYRRVGALLVLKNLTNVRLEHRSTHCDDYTRAPDGTFDFALIDGACRSDCVPVCLAVVRSGGYIYLDNTDKRGDLRIAEARLLEAAAWHRHYTDFGPGLAAAIQGLLVRLPEH
jgi:predicted O-methyltransferase YrrM